MCWDWMACVGLGWDGMPGFVLAPEPRTAVGPGCTPHPTVSGPPGCPLPGTCRPAPLH